MASKKRNSSVLDAVSELIRTTPTQVSTQVDEVLSKLRETCQEIISDAEQEATLIVTEAAQRTQAMNKELEEEKKRIASTHAFGPMVKLDVGGNLFTTATATLTRFSDTMLGAMFSGRHALIQDSNGAYCIDRDGRHFHEILNFLRGTAASTQQQIEQRYTPEALKELKVETDFYGVKDLMFPMKTISITGATGQYAGQINGEYQETPELSGGMLIYIKVGDASMCLEYFASGKSWRVKASANKGTDTQQGQVAYCTVPAPCLPQECPVGQWIVLNSIDCYWHPQPAMTIKKVLNDK